MSMFDDVGDFVASVSPDINSSIGITSHQVSSDGMHQTGQESGLQESLRNNSKEWNCRKESRERWQRKTFNQATST